MKDLDIYNLYINAKYAKGFCEMYEKAGYDYIRVGELIKYCSPRIELRNERYQKMKELSQLRPIWNFKELAARLGTSRQTLYNWKDEGWIVTDRDGKADLARTTKLWEDFDWNT